MYFTDDRNSYFSAVSCVLATCFNVNWDPAPKYVFVGTLSAYIVLHGSHKNT